MNEVVFLPNMVLKLLLFTLAVRLVTKISLIVRVVARFKNQKNRYQFGISLSLTINRIP